MKALPLRFQYLHIGYGIDIGEALINQTYDSFRSPRAKWYLVRTIGRMICAEVIRFWR